MTEWRDLGTIVVAAIFLLPLQACGVPDRRASRAPKDQVQPGATSSMTKAEDEKLRAAFEKMAPKGWALKSYKKNIASYEVSIPSISPAHPSINVSGTITFDARNEEMVKMGRAIYRSSTSTADEIAEAAALYQDFEGYSKLVSVETYGYDINNQKTIRKLQYFDLDKQISCYGDDPGQFYCFWGNKNKRLSLYPYSKDLPIILPYIQRIASSER